MSSSEQITLTPEQVYERATELVGKRIIVRIRGDGSAGSYLWLLEIGEEFGRTAYLVGDKEPDGAQWWTTFRSAVSLEPADT